MTGYDLSRKWFDWSFENPEKVSPNHSAIFFFAIEHCNRLGWKDKFGFPTQMTMDAIGIKKHQTYIKYFNDLCDWGFFKLIQKSTNQYSANIISLSCGMLKNGKALDKANITHAAKQSASIGQSNGQSNSSIDKQLTIEQLTTNKKGWRDDFNVYLEELNVEYNKLKDDTRFIDEQQYFHPNVDILKTMMKAYTNYWTKPDKGWKKKKASKTLKIDWRETIINSLDMSYNKVYLSKDEQIVVQQNIERAIREQNKQRAVI